ncbi:FUSC family protein [Glutamicibacter sp. MNS18]|uniref:FUSC family protein n=1 Tax=Glutamicibacter sp. MNS18 TaxID=2989817 RepID=UPI002236B6E3|nr:FUSC family protein [Glutamicibacter sp. MNS18]MCW4467300.1 FUSC family protein [Glutamicibacter sp. MNS18]
MASATKFKRAQQFVRQRNKVGFVRARNSLPRIIRMTIAAIGAYWVAESLLGHTQPIFAATSALIASGFGASTTMRKVLEVALGCTLGVAMGDFLMHWWGQGLWQAAAVMSLSLLVARYLNSGPIFSTQLGMQSALVVLMPISVDGPFGRSVDAVLGAGLAIVLMILLPTDSRRTPIAALSELLRELAEVLLECSWAVRDDDHRAAFHALVKARATQRHVDKLPQAFSTALEVATFAPTQRRHRHEIRRLSERREKFDLAARNLRVFVRRLAAVLSQSALSREGAEQISALLRELSEAVGTLSYSVRESTVAGQRKYERLARRQLEDCAARLDPRAMGIEGMQGEGLVLLLRPMVVDLLQAAGQDHDGAVAPLPPLDD